MKVSARWRAFAVAALVSALFGSGCYTKLAHRPVEVDGEGITTYRVDYRDDCSSCHRGNPYQQVAFGPAFYHDPDLYAWQWYYAVPWWADAPYLGGGDNAVAPQSEARDFSRRQVAPPEATYAPATVGGQSGMAPPIGKTSADSGQTPAAAPAPEPRRDFSRRQVEQAGEHQRQPTSAGQNQTDQTKTKKQE
ncbi:MAG: hypothetical protein H5U38_09930 [Calditrichaeota bacterium]|nr:hypothetical protein [Calditrichota bacterium]